MKESIALGFAGATPGNNTATTVLFDSTVGYEPGSPPALGRFRRYLLSLQNSHAGTLKVSGSTDRGKTWDPAHISLALAAGAPTNEVVIALGVHPDIKVEWVNGGTAQSPWVVQQGLDDDFAPLGTVTSSSGSSTSAFTSTQLPAALGQTTKLLSMSVVEASDVDRAPLRLEVLVFGVTNASVTYNTPDGSLTNQPDWRGKSIEAFAELSDCYLQFSTGTNAAVNEAQVSTTTPVSGRTSVSPQGDECVVIPRGCSRKIAVLPTYQSFALKGSIANSRLRTQIL